MNLVPIGQQVKAVASFLVGLLATITGVLAVLDNVPAWVPILIGALTPIVQYISVYRATNADFVDEDPRDIPA